MDTGESAKETVKTIARGIRADRAEPVVTCLCASCLRTQGCGRGWRPAFPAPSDFLRDDLTYTSDASRREIAESYPLGCLTIRLRCFLPSRLAGAERVGWAKARKRRAHHDRGATVGSLRSAHPT